MLLSAAPGWEFADLGGRHHLGGGSHGSLSAGDSEVPILTIGIDGEPRSITDLAPLALGALGIGRPPPHRSPVPPPERALMVELQLRRRGIKDPRVLEAMGRVPRERFVPDDLRASAYDDEPLPIGYEATISQPYMVAAICELLGLSGDERVLDVGTGSGYQAAVLAELAREVVSIERVPELAASARATLDGAGYGQVEVVTGDGTLGLPERAPFDAIAVAAAAPDLPPALYAQLVPGGRIVLPVGERRGQRLELVVRSPEGPAVLRSMPCRFVPLLGSGGFDR